MCDGAFQADIRYGAYGIIVYDSEGRVVDGRARSFFCRAPLCAEALVILEALQIAASDQVDTIVLTDSKSIVLALENHKDDWPWEAASFIAQIKQVMETSSNIHVIWVRRDEIREADRVAKLARDNRLPLNWVELL
ncbi:hypothetical protein LINPERPRIM_LOCUS21725 [Linum perenne]